VLLVDGIHTLVDVIIIDPVQAYLVLCVVSFCEVVATMAIQAKERLYHNWHITNAFFPLTMEVFDCLHRQMYNFFHQYANMA
jgi:hypothetical protein